MLSPSSKIWVYQASRTLSVNEFASISKKLKVFAAEWSSHGSKLFVDYEIKHFRFIVIAVDESQASTVSGCSIDKSVHFMTELGNELGVDFMDRNLIYVIGDKLHTAEIKNLKAEVLAQRIKPSTLVFDNTITTFEEFEKRWNVEASKTWLKRYFDSALV